MYSYLKTIPDEVHEPPPRIVVIPDVHGDLQKARACMLLSGLIDESEAWTADPPNTVVVQVGDQVDGGKRDCSGEQSEHACHASLKRDMEILRFFNR